MLGLCSGTGDGELIKLGGGSSWRRTLCRFARPYCPTFHARLAGSHMVGARNNHGTPAIHIRILCVV